MTEVIQHVVSWLSTGSTYALFALGLAIVFSIAGLINFAHGELVTIAGYVMVGALSLGLGWILVVPIALAVTALAAIGMERVAFRPFRRAPLSTLLLASLVVSLMIQAALQLAVSARPKPIDVPSWTQSAISIGDVRISVLSVLTLVVTAAALVSLSVFLKRSVFGLALRAAAEDFAVTRLMGFRANRILSLAFAASGLFAGIGAFFYLMTVGVVTPATGANPLLKGFIAAVIGGVGSLSGAVLGAFVLAGLETFFTVTLPDGVAPYINTVVFTIVVIVLLVRPQGLFAARSTAAERL